MNALGGLGQFVRDKRLAKGLTGRELALAVALDPATLSRLETGMMKTLPEPPSAASLEETHRLLSALAGDVAMLAAFAPDRLAAIMRAHGITAQLHDGGVRLVWPESLRYFFER